VRCALWHWEPPTAAVGLVVLFHGMGSHARFPSTSLAAEVLSAGGFAVCSPDMPGHGESDGLRGFLLSSEALEEDGEAFAREARRLKPGLPLFLAGSSMGGAIAFRVAQRLDGVSGLVLLAPMLAPPASAAAAYLLAALSYTPLCRLPLIPSSATDNAKQYSDEAIIKRVDADHLSYKGALRVGSASACVSLGAACEATLPGLACPFFCLLADRELVLSEAAREAAERLCEVAATPAADRTLKRYDALHALLCEPEPLRSTIAGDILAWMRRYAAGEST